MKGLGASDADREGRSSTSLRILLLLHQPADSGGDMSRAVSLARELDRLGQRVTIAWEPAIDRPEIISPEGDVLETPCFRPRALQVRGLEPRSLIWRWSQLRDRQYDIVHTFAVRPSTILPAVALQRRGSLWVADWSDYWGWGGIADQRRAIARWSIGLLDTVLERWSRRRADGVTVVSTFLERLSRDWGASEGRILNLGIGADVENIKPMDRAEARQKLRIDPRWPVVVFSGQSTFDLEQVGQTFRRLQELEPETRLFLLGKANAADLRLSGQAAEANVVEWGFLGIRAMADVIGCSDVALLPMQDSQFSRARFPNRLGDYLAAGRPVVANPTGDTGSFIRERRVGLVVEHDPDRMAGAVADLFGDPDRAADMGARGRQVAENELRWARRAASLQEFYISLVRRSSGRRAGAPEPRGG